MKVTKSTRKRIYTLQAKDRDNQLSPLLQDLANALLLIDRLPNKRPNAVQTKARDSSVFRSNIGKFIASERNETETAVMATRRDPAAIAKKYEAL